MLLGSREEFGIELFLEEDLTPPSAMWGRMRVWVEDHSFGDFDNPHCALYPAYDKFSDLIKNIDELYESDFINLDPDECYRRVDESIYGKYVDDELVDSEFEQYSDKYTKHDFLTNWGEMFDLTIKPFIFRQEKDHMIVFQPDPWSGKVKTYRCSVEVFLKVVRQFKSWFEENSKELET